jgi:hypothetical protein
MSGMKRLWLRRIVILVGVTLFLAPVVSFAVSAFFWSQRADYGWAPPVAQPTFADPHPRVVVDQAHGNASTIEFAGRYWPFALLLRADGFDVRKGKTRFFPGSLEGVDVLVIANASGADKRQAFGVNLPDFRRKDPDRSAAAFTPEEVEMVRDWVHSGGSLLLIADHAPFGAASAGMGEAFGVTMYRGFVEVPGEVSDPLLFSRENGRLGDHPILRGADSGSAVTRVMTFTGQSLDGPADASVLLRLPETAIEYLPTGRENQYDSVAAGSAQGLAFEFGRGRVVVLGEAAMLTAQVSNRQPFGMNSPGNDNALFALNVMHWLAREL